MRSGELKSAQFRREREQAWRELEEMVARCERSGMRVLDAVDVLQLTTLYQHAVGSLSTARAISLDRNVVSYLEALVARAHLCVYGFRQTPLRAVAEFAGKTFPRAVRRRGWHVLASLAVLAGTVAVGARLVATDETRYYTLVSLERAQGRTPAASTDSLRGALYDRGTGAAFELESFATALFTHNAQVGLLCAALGAAAGLPIPPLLATTGLELGAMSELYRSRGLGTEFWAWILPHGVTELLAVVLCAGAGLSIGFAFIAPGPRTRRDAVAEAGRDAGRIVLGAMAMFVVAAAFEGVFRQTVGSPAVRWTVAAAFASFWTVYFGWAGRRGEDDAR